MTPVQNHFLAVCDYKIYRSDKPNNAFWSGMSARQLMNVVRWYRRRADRSFYNTDGLPAFVPIMERYAVIREKAWA